MATIPKAQRPAAAANRIEQHGSRADDTAGAARRYLVGVNTGGVVVLLASAAVLLQHRYPIGWMITPLWLFVVGIAVTVFSVMVQKHKALSRKRAAAEQNAPEFGGLLASWVWDVAAGLLFLAGAWLVLTEFEQLATALDGRPQGMRAFMRMF